MGMRLEAGELRTGLPVAAFPAGVPSAEAGRGMNAFVFAEPAVPAQRRRYAIPALLVAGWGGLFAYCAAYLREDLPFRPTALVEAAKTAEDAPRPTIVLPDMQDVPARTQAQATPESERPVAALPAVQPVPAAAPRPASAPVADYVGTWGPTPAACGSPSRRRGYLPAMITADRARAGRTLCTFHDGHRAGNAWLMAAECTDRGRRWSSQVRLTVDGDRLTWASNRGTAAYVRCNRRAG